MTVPALQSFTQLVSNQTAAIQRSQSTLVKFTAGSILGALTEAVADVCLFIQSQIMQVLSQIRAATSQGADLDSWAADFGFLRLGPENATGQVTFSRFSATEPAIVPVGAKVQSADGSQQFVVLADTTNTAYSSAIAPNGGFSIIGGVPSLTVTAQAVNGGSQGNV